MSSFCFLTNEDYSKRICLHTNVLKVFYTWIYNRTHCPKSNYKANKILYTFSGDVSLGSQANLSFKIILSVYRLLRLLRPRCAGSHTVRTAREVTLIYQSALLGAASL